MYLAYDSILINDKRGVADFNQVWAPYLYKVRRVICIKTRLLFVKTAEMNLFLL